MIHKAKALDGKLQEFNTYIYRKTGQYKVRFKVKDYKYNQVAGSGSLFNNECDAIKHGAWISRHLRNSFNTENIRALCDANVSFRKATGKNFYEVEEESCACLP